ncbi:MAG TPA: endolytic transglycosylase MltG [Agitococcus sp.]|nr:endolytic transglycosylase MltG [Agitococcus sp.]HNP01417.1 endolytic transglycosylase MltG [Agitococcus sp.]
MSEQVPKTPRNSKTKSSETQTKARSNRSKSRTKPTQQAEKKPRVTTKKTISQKNNTVKKNYLKVVFASLIVVILAVSLWLYQGLFSALAMPSTGYKIAIEKGSSYSQVLQQLEKDQLLPSALLAKAYLKVNAPKNLQIGTYLFKQPISLVRLLTQLSKGEGLVMTKITVIEGTTFKQLRQQIEKNSEIKQTLLGKSDVEVLAMLGVPIQHPEGLFAPDTYIFALDDTDLKVLKRLYQQQEKILNKAWQNRAENLPYKTPYEALIMASIVEKETGAAAERPLIAGVFINRLRIGMRLQTDPTVIYGMGDNYNGNIRKSDLLTYTPYNTYKINGLPPTPIALPSKAAIEAALQPAKTQALYFVAKGDGSGEHTFSDSLAAHNQAVADYLQTRRERR